MPIAKLRSTTDIVGRLKCTRSKADPCLYFRWTDTGTLLLWFSWFDERFFITGPETDLLELKENIMKEVECDDSGEIQEFVGCKIDHDKEKRSMKITQPVLLQSFKDEFGVETGNEVPKTPGIPYKALRLGNEPILEGKRNTYFRSGIGKLMHMRRWSRPELTNALRDLSRYNTNTTIAHIDAMYRTMRYAMNTPCRGLTLAPKDVWDGNPELTFRINGYADASYKPYQDATTSVGGHAVFLQDAPIAEKTKVQQSTTLSITEAELCSGTECAQDMLFAMRVLDSIGLKVEKPMMLSIDNKGAVNYASNWSTARRMRYASIRLGFLRELKEANLV
jgi:hypothetical protein